MRAFIAIEVPDEIKVKLMKISEPLDTTGIKVISKEQLHITLFFLGEINEQQESQVELMMSNINKKRFKIEVNGIGVFNEERPGVVFAKTKHNAEILDLYNEMRQKIEKIGVKLEDRELKPHITIARVKKPEKLLVQGVMNYVEANQDTEIGIFMCEKLALKESVPTQNGHIYGVLYEKKLE